MKYKIRFVEGEPRCRINEELCSDEWLIKNIGTTEDIQIEKNYIVTDDSIYIKKFDVLTILQAFGEFHGPLEKYDKILSQGKGSSSHYTEERILGKKTACVIKEPEAYKDFKILPFDQFKIDYPKFNLKNHKELNKAFDEFYKRK